MQGPIRHVSTTIIDILGVPFLDSPSLESSFRVSCKVAIDQGDLTSMVCVVNRPDDIQVRNRGHGDHLDLQPIALPDRAPRTATLEWLDSGVLRRLAHFSGNIFSNG